MKKIVIKNISFEESNILLHYISNNEKNLFVNKISDLVKSHKFEDNVLTLEILDILAEFAVHELSSFKYVDEITLNQIKHFVNKFNEKQIEEFVVNVIDHFNYLNAPSIVVDIVNKNMRYLIGNKYDDILTILCSKDF